MTFHPIRLGLLAVLSICLAPASGRAEPPAAGRTTQLIGYGIVMGLNGTGDHLSAAPFTAQALKTWLGKAQASADDLSSFDRNLAAVIVTASLPIDPSDARPMDLHVSAIGDATSLAGGKLAMTALLGPDGEAHAVGEGALRACAPPNPGDGCLTKGCAVPQCVPGGGHR